MSRVETELNQLNKEYMDVHQRKEDLFWDTYMGISSDQAAFDQAELAYKQFISDPQRLEKVRKLLEEVEVYEQTQSRALQGWSKFFAAHTIENETARNLQKELIAMEGRIFQGRSKCELSYQDESGKKVPCSSLVLSTNLRTHPSEKVRKSSHEGLLQLEKWVLDNGFLELVKTRNAFARAMGFPNFFAYRVDHVEHMTPEALAGYLDEFEALTRKKCFAELEKMAAEKGPDAVAAHNLYFSFRGDAERAIDPYLPFARSIRAWTESFGRMGIHYHQAELKLDLLDRKGKYENGFMHGPRPAFYDNGQWLPAAINFTSNATPNQVGSGRRGLETLFHEGGHAAHFANIMMEAPCFSQEFAPTSMAYAETQSMFLDSLTKDGAWLDAYARDMEGNAPDEETIAALMTVDHPLMAFVERSILAVSQFEKALYDLRDDQLNAQRVLDLARECEQNILGVSPGPRPMLAIPHLLSDDSACSYHGYLLAEMAVYQTRAFFLGRDGYLVDNPAIGPDLAHHYWRQGNWISFAQTVESLTQKPFSPKALANHCNRDTKDLWAEEKMRIKAARKRERAPIQDLEADIKIVHGTQVLADNSAGQEALCSDFESYIVENYPTKA